jgi:isopentenyl diphosphate isomerase/L-lactate dehydrogenase-like FMN-dependent dehydrogenase
VIPENDPALQAALAAPLDDETETEIEAQAIEVARREGRFVDGAVVSAEVTERVVRGA